jgi:hypothetical protein
MKKSFLLLVCICALVWNGHAQDSTESEVQRGFKKENLFTGGSISLSFFNNSFLVGGNPVFGYSLARWVDLGLVFNYNYTSFRDYYAVDDKLRQTVYGGGVFTRLFPVRFIFAQAQIEHNWTSQKYIPPYNGAKETDHFSSNSVLVGGGYTTGRDPDEKSTYGYLAILFDISKNKYSPYTDNLNRALPIIRAGIHIPLFQGRGER